MVTVRIFVQYLQKRESIQKQPFHHGSPQLFEDSAPTFCVPQFSEAADSPIALFFCSFINWHSSCNAASAQLENRMNAKHCSRLLNLNRVLIFVLTLVSLLMDGLQVADLFGTLALAVWLWLPLCTRLEAHLLHRIDGKNGSAGTSPSM
jgi:hypothetical protein